MSTENQKARVSDDTYAKQEVRANATLASLRSRKPVGECRSARRPLNALLAAFVVAKRPSSLFIAILALSIAACVPARAEGDDWKLRLAVVHATPLTTADQETLRAFAKSPQRIGDLYSATQAAHDSHEPTFIRIALDPLTTLRARTLILERFGPGIHEPATLKDIYSQDEVEPFQQLAALRAAYSSDPTWALGELQRLILGGSARFSRYQMWEAALGIADPALLPPTRDRLATSGCYSELVGALSLLVAIGPEEEDRSTLEIYRSKDGLSSIAIAGLASLGDYQSLRSTILLLSRRRVPGFLGQGYPTPITRVIRRNRSLTVAALSEVPTGLYGQDAQLWIYAAIDSGHPAGVIPSRLAELAKEANSPHLSSEDEPASTFTVLGELVDLAVYYGLDLEGILEGLPIHDASLKANLIDQYRRCAVGADGGPPPTRVQRAACINGMHLVPDPPDIEERLGYNLWSSRFVLVPTP